MLPLCCIRTWMTAVAHVTRDRNGQKRTTHSPALPLFWTVGANRISAVRSRALPPHANPSLSCKQDSQSSVKSIGQAVNSCHSATSSLEKKSDGLDCQGTLSIHATKPRDSSREQAARMTRFMWSLVDLHSTKQVCAAWLPVQKWQLSSLSQRSWWHAEQQLWLPVQRWWFLGPHAWWSAENWGQSSHWRMPNILPVLSYATPPTPEYFPFTNKDVEAKKTFNQLTVQLTWTCIW